MNLVSQYVLRVGAYSIFALLLDGIMPPGSSKKILKLMISLVYMYVLIQPVISWIQQDIPLEKLTLTEFEWWEDESLNMGEDYEEQAVSMVGQGFENELKKKGLPKELEDQYQILEIEIGDVIEVELARIDRIGSLTDRSLDLGKIGSSEEEIEVLVSGLSEYWGIRQDDLEMRLR